MEKQDLIDDWRKNTYDTFADREIWKRDNQRKLIVVLWWDEITIKHEYEQEIYHQKKQ